MKALLQSEYKHHTTFKVLVCITPNGAISLISPANGGRASDKFIVNDSGFLDSLESSDFVMAERGFKIRELLLMIRCTLAIPPRAAKGNQMTEQEIKETKRIANVRIYVEQAIVDYNKEFQTISDIIIRARKKELAIFVASVHIVWRGVFVTDFPNTA